MEPNPYEAPHADCRVEQAALVPERTVRRGVPLVIAVAWNLPLLVVLVLTFAEIIGIDAMYRLVAAWSLVIPIASIALIFFRPLQWVVFVDGIDMAKMRPRLWGLAFLWLAILGVWLLSRLAWSV